jgi:hypothetical protein
MTYNYASSQGSPLYHIVKVGRTYALCGLGVQRGKIIYPEPPVWKNECEKCAKALRGQLGTALLKS